MKYDLFDLHCDTLTVLARSGRTWRGAGDGVMLRRTDAYAFESFTQFFAVYANPALPDDEAYTEAADILRRAADILSLGDENSAGITAHLTVEDGRILGGELDRVDALAALGVRAMTSVWGGESCIGGAWDTMTEQNPRGIGLSAFGRQAVERCLLRGIIPDLSHASEASFYDSAEIIDAYNEAHGVTIPLLATHSSSRAVCPHRRNLTDEQFSMIVRSGGICGISLYPPHLRGEEASVSDAAAHILHYLALGGEKTVCLGCDYDGIERTPQGLEHASELGKIASALEAEGVKEETLRGIFARNAQRYLDFTAEQFKKAAAQA